MTASRGDIGSDLAKVDAYENTPADYAELPELDAGFFAEAKAELGGKPIGRPPIGDKPKKQLTLRLDEIVIAKFKATGTGWQSRMNVFLRENDTVLRMMMEQLDLLDDIDDLAHQFEVGGLRMVTEPAEKTVARLQRNAANVKATLNGLREQLRFER